MERIEAIEGYLNRVADGIKQDAESKGQKFPVSSIRVEITPESGDLYAADYAKYLIYGRPPGKQPPLENIVKWVESQGFLTKQTKIQAQFQREGRSVDRSTEYEQIAFLIARKIGRDGSDIWQGKKEGIDLLTAMDNAKPQFLKDLQKGEIIEITTTLKEAIR